VNWIPIGLFISACSIDIQWFPFDDQKCTMKFGSWTYDGTKINLTSKSDSIDLSTYQISGEWDLLGTSSYYCIGLSRYIAITQLSIIAVIEYLRQLLIDLNQIYRHSSVPKNTSTCIFQLLSSKGFRARRRRDFFCHLVPVTV